MKWSYLIAAGLIAASSPAVADDVSTASRVMREALIEHAPVPSRPPVLPDRGAPSALTREHLAATGSEAERAARNRAERDARSRAEALKAEAANHAALMPMMRGGSGMAAPDASTGSMPADMMKSRGKMAGGGMMPGGTMPGSTGMPGGSGMPSGGGSNGGMMLRSTGSQVASPPEPAGGARR